MIAIVIIEPTSEFLTSGLTSSRQQVPVKGAGDDNQSRTANAQKHIRSPVLDGTPLEEFQVACFALFARLGSVRRTARTHANQRTAKKSVSETGKLSAG